MPEETVDPGLLEQTKNQIRRLVAEIADLAEADIRPPEFHDGFLARVVESVAAEGGALWLLDGRGGLKLSHQIEFRRTGLLDGRVRTSPHDALLGIMIQSSRTLIVPPGAAVEGVPNAGNPTPFALILAPLIVDKQAIGLLEILMDPNRRAATQHSTLRFVGDLADLASRYHKNRQLRSLQRQWGRFERFVDQIHGSLDRKETAYAVANEGKRLIGVDRLSVAVGSGRRASIVAISGQEVVEQRSNLARELARLCEAVIRSGEGLAYTGDSEGLAPEVRAALEPYLDESGSRTVIIELLREPDDGRQPSSGVDRGRRAFGCLVADQFGVEQGLAEVQIQAQTVARHAATALWNASGRGSTVVRPLVRAIGGSWSRLRGWVAGEGRPARPTGGARPAPALPEVWRPPAADAGEEVRRVERLAFGEAAYPLRAPLECRFLPRAEGGPRLEALGPDLVGRGAGFDEALDDFQLKVHAAFQKLVHRQPSAMTDEERERWSVLERAIDVPAYRAQLPLVFTQTGRVVAAAAGPSAVAWWPSDREEAVDPRQFPTEFAGFALGQWFEAIVERERLGRRLRRVRHVRPVEPIVPMQADHADELWQSFTPSTALPASTRDWTVSSAG